MGGPDVYILSWCPTADTAQMENYSYSFVISLFPLWEFCLSGDLPQCFYEKHYVTVRLV